MKIWATIKAWIKELDEEWDQEISHNSSTEESSPREVEVLPQQHNGSAPAP